MTRNRILAALLLAAAGTAAAIILSVTGPLDTPARATDTDSDGLSDAFEAAYGTDPNEGDSDGDGWSDWDEIFVHGTDPLDADTDGDSLPDNSDTYPLDYSGSEDGVSTPSLSWSGNLAAPALTGASAMDGTGLYPHSGEFVHAESLLSVRPGYGPPIVLTLAYGSGVSYDGRVGKNWMFSLAEHLVEQGGGDVDMYVGMGFSRLRVPPGGGGGGRGAPPGGGNGEGRKVTFGHPGGTPGTPFEYEPVAEAPGVVLTKNADSSWTLRDAGGNTRTYASNGRLTTYGDRFGNQVTLSYTSGRVSSATDASGHTVTMTYYSGTGRLKDVTDDDGRTTTLVYNAKGQLARIVSPTSTEYPSGRVTQFRYTNGSTDATLNDNLIRITDPRGQVWLRNEYDANDRLSKQYVGQGHYALSYSGSATTVIDREGNQRVWNWSGNLPTSLVEHSNRDVRSSDPSTWTTAFAHNAASLLSRIVHPRGNRVDFTYDASGNMTERRRRETDTGTNQSSDLVDTWTYDATYGLVTSHVDPKGNETTYTLDTADRVVETITFETVTYTDPDQTSTRTFTWNAQGQMTSSTDEEGTETEYAYYTSGLRKGYLQSRTVDPAGLALTTSFDYTNFGAVTATTNPRGKTTTFDVNEYGWVLSRTGTSPQGYEVLYTYDANGNLTQKDVENVDGTNTRDTANPWWTTTYTYNLLDDLTSKTEEIDLTTTRTTTYAYTLNQKLKTLTKPEGNKVRTVYDERDLVYTVTRGFDSAVASTETFDYDGNRNLVTRTDGRGKDWSHEYDLFDRRVKSLNPLGNYTTWDHDRNGNVTDVKRFDEEGETDVLMEHTKFSYDERDRRFKVERGLKGVSSWSFLATTTTFDGTGRPVEVEDPRGKKTSYEYDAAGRMTSSTDEVDHETTMTYDPNGNVLRKDTRCFAGCSLMRSGIVEYVYDAVDRVETMEQVDEGNDENRLTWTYKHTSLDVRVEQVDPEENVQTWSHDGLGRVLTHVKVLASGEITRTWGFDRNDRLVSHRDDGNNETTWDFNERDLCTLETYPDAGTKSFEYDLADNVTGWEDPNGTTVEMAYDDAGRKTSVEVTRATGVLGTTAEAWVYDALDRVVEATDNDVTVLLTYDSLGRTTSETSGPNPISTHGKTTSYTYDGSDNLTGITYPVGSFSVARTVDDVNRLTLVEDGSSNDIVAIGHDATSGRMETLTFGNGTTTTFGHDGFGRITSIDHATSSPASFAGYAMGHDRVGNIVFEEWTHASGKGNNYAYDRAYRLTKALMGTEDPSAEHASPGSEVYDHRIIYNLSDDSDRTSVVTNPYGGGNTTVSYTSNNVHEYTVIDSVNRTHDDNGNLTDDGTREFHYDYRNQLVRVTEGETVLAEYEYDALGRRTKKTVDADVTRYYHDGVHEIVEVDGSGALLRRYVYRDDIDSIAMMEAVDQADVDDDANTSELVRLYFHVDPRTNVAYLSGPDESVVESYVYDPYGNVTIRDQAGDPVASSPVGNPFTFQRRRLDEETGLYYFRARHYDPVAGQWMQRDPLGLEPGANWREFVSSAPTTTTDPDGLRAMPGGVGGLAGEGLGMGALPGTRADCGIDWDRFWRGVAYDIGIVDTKPDILHPPPPPPPPGGTSGRGEAAFVDCYWDCLTAAAEEVGKGLLMAATTTVAITSDKDGKAIVKSVGGKMLGVLGAEAIQGLTPAQLTKLTAKGIVGLVVGTSLICTWRCR